MYTQHLILTEKLQKKTERLTLQNLKWRTQQLSCQSLVYPVSLHVSAVSSALPWWAPVSFAPHGPGPPFPPPVPPPLHRPPGLCFVWSVWKPLFGGGLCHESGCHSLHLLHHTTAAHHLWTASPIIHCTHTFPSTITPITELSPITHLSWLSYHTCTSFTHTHLSSTLPCKQGQGFFICHIINYTGYNQKWNVDQIRSAQWTVQRIKKWYKSNTTQEHIYS